MKSHQKKKRKDVGYPEPKASVLYRETMIEDRIILVES